MKKDKPVFKDPTTEDAFRAFTDVLSDFKKRLDGIDESIKNNHETLRKLNEAVSRLTYVRGRFIFLTYNHDTQELCFTDQLCMRFDGNEAELLSYMFVKSTGKPKKKRFTCGDVADHFKEQRKDLSTPRRVYEAIRRIKSKIEQRHKLGGLFIVTSKEFYIIRR